MTSANGQNLESRLETTASRLAATLEGAVELGDYERARRLTRELDQTLVGLEELQRG